MGKNENRHLGTLGGFSQQNSFLPKGSSENRREPRYMVTWRSAISLDGKTFHYGRAKDISLHGAALLNELNLKPGTRVTLKIHIPTLDRSTEPKTLITGGKVAYTVYDADRMCFRVGVSFDEFAQESDRAYLEERLINYHVQAPDYVSRRNTDRIM